MNKQNDDLGDAMAGGNEMSAKAPAWKNILDRVGAMIGGAPGALAIESEAPIPAGRKARNSGPNSLESSGAAESVAPAKSPVAVALEKSGTALSPDHIGDGAAFARSGELDATRLPALAKKRLRRLKDIVADNRAANGGLAGESQDLLLQIMAKGQRVKKLEGMLHIAKDADHKALIAAESTALDELKSERDHIEARRFAFSQKAGAAEHLIQCANRYLRFVSYQVTAAKPSAVPKGATCEGLIEKIGHLRADRQEIETAPIPAVIAKQRAEKQIADLAERGRPIVYRLIEGGEIEWPTCRAEIRIRDKNDWKTEHARVVDSAAMFAFLNREKLLEAVLAQVDEEADDSIAIDPDSRPAMINKIDEQILELERQVVELAWVTDAIETIPSEVDPRALLSIDGPRPREW